MNEQKKKEILLKCVEIAENLVPIFKNTQPLYVIYGGKQFYIDWKKFNKDKNRQKVILFDEKVFIYLGDYNKVYNQIRGQILASLRKNRYLAKDAFSKKYISDFIDTIVHNVLNEGIDYVRENPLHVDMFDKFFNELIVFMPLDGIKLSVDSFSLGKIFLTIMSEEKIRKISTGSHFSSPEYYEDLIGRTCAGFKTFAESKSAYEQAKEEIENFLNLINYSVPFIYPKKLGVSVGLQGKMGILTSKVYITNSDLTGAGFQHNYPQGKYPFDISDRNIEIMKRIGVFKISDILNKHSKKSNFEQTILLGVHWFADSQIQTKLQNEFLSLMICLEIFLTPNDKRDPISTSIAEAIAIILKSENKRKSFRNEIKGYYDIRSDIVHGRNVKLKEEEVDMLRDHIKQLIRFMIRHKDYFSSKEDLMEKISQYKLSGINFDLKMKLF